MLVGGQLQGQRGVTVERVTFLSLTSSCFLNSVRCQGLLESYWSIPFYATWNIKGILVSFTQF